MFIKVDNTSDDDRSISANNGYINNTKNHNAHKQISRHITEHLGDMIGLVLPPALSSMVDDLVELAVKSMPSESLLSLYRVLLDGAFMLTSRVLNERLRLDGGATRYVMADSSQQHGDQFEVIQVQTIPNRDIGQAFRLAGDLYRLRSEHGESCAVDVFEREKAIMKKLEEVLSDTRVLPLLSLGSGRSSLAITFQADC